LIEVQDLEAAKQATALLQAIPALALGLPMGGAILLVVRMMLNSQKEDRVAFLETIKADRESHAEEMKGINDAIGTGFRELRDVYGRRTG